MTLRVAHSHQTIIANDPQKDVSKNAWNADHTLTGTLDPADIPIATTSLLGGVIPDGTTISVSGTGVISVIGRSVLSGNRTYYVRKDGNDSNNGLTDNSAGAFLTIGKAMSVSSMIDFNGNTVTVQVRPGTYAEQVVIPVVVGAATYSSFVLQGDAGTPSNVVIAGPFDFVGVFDASVGVKALVQGFKITGSGNSIGFYAHDGGFVAFNNIEFSTGCYAHISAAYNGTVNFNFTTYTITAGATVHINVENGGAMFGQFGSVTLTGTPAFSYAFANANLLGVMRVDGNTYTGAATGTRYAATNNGAVNTNGGGATYFPGNGAGTVSGGGLYV